MKLRVKNQRKELRTLTELDTSSTGRRVKPWMFTEARMKKEEQLSFGTSITATTRNGKLSMLTNLIKIKLKDFTRTSE
jgi:hypothetical protein